MAKWDLVIANVDPGHQGVEAVAHVLFFAARRHNARRPRLGTLAAGGSSSGRHPVRYRFVKTESGVESHFPHYASCVPLNMHIKQNILFLKAG